MINELFVLLLTCCNTDMEINLIAVEKQTLLLVSQQNIRELCLASGEGKSVPFLRIEPLGGGVDNLKHMDTDERPGDRGCRPLTPGERPLSDLSLGGVLSPGISLNNGRNRKCSFL
jgi:hypothetical protein